MHNAGCERAGEAHWVSHRDDQLARLHHTVPNSRGAQIGDWQLQLRQIPLVISCLDVRWDGSPIPQFNQVRALPEDMSIGDDRSFGVPDHS